MQLTEDRAVRSLWIYRKTVAKVTISEELAAFREEFPGCVAVAFADLSTGMVLASSTEHKTAQEKMDQLCDTGCTSLLGKDSARVGNLFGAPECRGPSIAWHADSDGLRCFIKAAAPCDEAICLVLSPNVAPAGICDGAARLLHRIAPEG